MREECKVNKSTEYYRDARHNYMILQCVGEKEQICSNYQYRMLAANKIEGLLPCSLRFIDGKGCIYYEITSRQSIDNLWGNSPVPGGQLKALLLELIGIEDRLSEYLLDSAGILLSPEYIYYDLLQERFYFSYFPETDPEQNSTQNSRFGELADFLALHIDENDRWAASCSYRFCTLADNPNYILSKELLEEKREARPVSDKDRTAFPEQDKNLCGEENMESMRPGKYDSHSEDIPYPEDEEPAEPGWQQAEPAAVKKPHSVWIGKIIIILTAALISVSLFLLRGESVKGTDEYFLFTCFMTAAISVAAVVTAYTAGIFFRSIIRKNGAKQDPEKSVLPVMEYPHTEKDSYTYHTDPEQANSVFSDNEVAYSCGRDNEQQAQEAGPKTFLETPHSTFAEETGPDVSEDKSAADEIAGKLYGTSRVSRKYRIDLNRLPCTVGKAPGFADLIIPEQSISGIHAKFFGKISEGSVTVQDLNSNGGTYVNGLRLMPNEAADIWPGDEVRLGDLCFCYR
jgi:hypothetical protein